MKDSFALRRMALDTMSWSSEEVKVHWAASNGRPFQGMGVGSKEVVGSGGRGGGATKVPTDGFGEREGWTGTLSGGSRDGPGCGEGGDEGTCIATSIMWKGTEALSSSCRDGMDCWY